MRFVENIFLDVVSLLFLISWSIFIVGWSTTGSGQSEETCGEDGGYLCHR